MLLPEAMSRIVIAGDRSRLDEVTDALYNLKQIHLIDHVTGMDDGFAIGAPRPYMTQVSERLLALRAVEKELGINIEKEVDEPAPVNEIRDKISSKRVEEITGEVFAVLERRSATAGKTADLKARRSELAALSSIPVDLDMYRGYSSIAVIVGTVRPAGKKKEDPIAKIREGLPECEFFVSDDKRTVAVFVRRSDKDEAMRVLSEFEFTEMTVPAGSGPVSDAVAECDAGLASLDSETEDIGKELAALKEKYEDEILTLDEELSVDEAKGGLPLRIATSGSSFVIDAWVPTAKTAAVSDALEKRMGGNICVEVQEDRSRSMHDEDHAEDRFKDTPSKMNNGRIVKNFEYPVELMTTPKYQEIDPTIILTIFFPLFFGFMVGDIGYAIPFIILGAYGLKSAKSKDFRGIATVLFFGGIWAFIFGFFFFGEMFGMHFAGAAGAKTETWESLFSLNFPDWFTNLLPQTDHGGVIHYGVSKVDDVTFLLQVSIYIGIIHMLLAYILGFVNIRMQHGTKEAFFEKGGWIMTFIGLVLFGRAMTWMFGIGPTIDGDLPVILLVIGVAILVAGVAVSFTKEGMQAVLEVPSLFGNILSYARLTAIGMSKAGMAMAFNYISITLIAAGLGGIPGIIVGLLLFSFLHLVIWTLAIISAGLHALRLQYVELMYKFYVGGGKDYEPLEIRRINTKIVETEV